MNEVLTALGAISLTTLIFILIWDIVWKGIALWKCGRRNQPIWFLFILIVNSCGILPIIYLIINSSKRSK